MQHKKIFNYFEIAAKITSKNRGRRRFLVGAIGIRGDGTMVSAFNGSSPRPNRKAHAEYRLASKLDYGAVVYVARVKVGDGTFGMAKPCKSCQKALKSKKVSRVYFTTGPNSYDYMDL